MSLRPVYLVDGTRTPFLKARNKPGPFSNADLAVAAGQPLLNRQPFSPEQLDEVVLGSTMPSADEANVGRVAALRLGCGKAMPAYTVMRNCASGMQAIDSAYINIAAGRTEMALAGGVDAMSRAPLLFSDEMVLWLSDWYAAKSLGQRIAALRRFKLGYLAPSIALLRGLTDPVAGLSMGQTAEIVAHRFGITRRQMDEYAVQSHQRLAKAIDAGYLKEVEPIYGPDGVLYEQDDGLRRDSNADKLGTLKPFFDKVYGHVTAANSSQITDGATWVLLASEDAVQRHGLKPLGKLLDVQWAGLDPAQMGLGPVHAIAPLLQRHQLTVADIDAWEINEAFAAQVLGCLAAMDSADYCRDELGLEAPLGAIPMDRLNLDGGGIALGHPVGSSGARIVLHLLHVLKRTGGRRGIASICIGGGLGGATLVETCQ